MQCLPRQSSSPCKPQLRRGARSPRLCVVRAVLEKKAPGRSDVPQQQQEQMAVRASLEALLPPSLAHTSRSSLGASSMPDTQQQQLDASQPLPPPPRVLTCLDGETLYFAYGANLALSTLKRRGVTPISRSPAVVVDPGVCLVFKHRGGYGSLAQLASLPEQAAKFPPYTGQAHGVVYQLSNADLKALAKFEGGYQLTDIEVETYDGWRVHARTFVSGPLAQLQREVAPTEKYMKLLRDGAGENYMDPLWQAWLSSIDTVTSTGLPAQYFDTPSKYVAYAFLAIVALVVVGFFAQ